MTTDIKHPLNMARQHIEACEDNDAQIILLEALKTDPNNMAGLLMLGGSYFSTEKYYEAETIFGQLILQEPGKGKFSVALFNVLMKLERHEEALEEIKRFMENADIKAEKATIAQYQEIIGTLFNNQTPPA